MHLFSDLVRVVLLAGLAVLGVQLALLVARARSVNLAGSPPIHWALFCLAKTALVVSFLCLIWGALTRRSLLTPVQAAVFFALFTPGCLLMALAFRRLGASLRMGLPDDPTSLVTTGIYGISRNPIYLGMFLLLGASLVYAFSWLNLAAAVLSILLHDRITRAEEKFLLSRFPAYDAYRRQVRRYL